MEITNSIPNFKVNINHDFVDKAENVKIKLLEKDVQPVYEIKLKEKDNDWVAENIGNAEQTEKYVLEKNSTMCYDFNRHCVGYISFDIEYIGSPTDAPAFLRLKFGEKLCEIGENSESYNGNLSSSWIQEEYIHIDEIPAHIELPRRYAFRYMEILVKDTSPSYKIKITNIKCKTVTSADISAVKELTVNDDELKKIDEISVMTMMECMQEVFEDGPKRDRRLWVGDLRVQALVNYETFKNYDLVKKCLYLFAGLRQNEGRVAACLYTKPKNIPSDIYLFDYALLFISSLYDYYNASNDIETLNELYSIANDQIEIASEYLDENGLVRDSNSWWCFLDWCKNLNKQAGAQAMFIYGLKQMRELAVITSNSTKPYDELIDKATNAAMKYLWDEEKGFFTSGSERQISWASQIWFVIAAVFGKDKNEELLQRMIKENPDVRIETPYMYHYFIQALVDSGMKEEAIKYIKYYWGDMVKNGADCFYEIYNVEKPDFSPYGSRIINSYCHAWSGTPAYFIRKYFQG